MRSNRRNIFIFTLVVGSILPAFSQSDNYWSWNFNTPSTLLAGAVVGGHAGPSAIYYNPAMVDHENVPTLSLSANILSLQFFDAENVAGKDLDASKFIFKVQPRFISYTIPTRNERLGLEVAILSPVSEEVRFSLQHEVEIDIIQRTTGPEVYTGYLNYYRKYDDTWIGAGLSYEFSKNFYVGASLFVSTKVLKYSYTQSAQAYQEKDSVLVGNQMEAKYIASSSFEEDFKYWFLSLIFKAGFQYKSNNEQFSAGINFTLPDVPVYGNGDVRKSVTRSNVYDDSIGAFTKNEKTLQFEEKTRVRVKNPFSVALGAQYTTASRKNAILLTIEYFNKIDSYAIMNSSLSSPNWLPGFIQDNLAGRDFMSYYFEARALTNIAVGFKQFISPSLFFLGGFRTDFTVNDSENPRFVSSKFSVNQYHINKYHLTAGAVLKIKQFSVIAGLQYSRGKIENAPEMVNYADPVEYISETEQSLEGVRQKDAVATMNEISLFFGLSVDLN